MPFLAGSATTNLTPDRALPNYNGSIVERGDGNSDLLCHAIAVSDGHAEAALISCDVTVVDRTLILRIREEVERRSGVPGNHLLIAATHTHAGPATGPSFLSGALPDPVYLDLFVERVTQAVSDAKARLQPAKFASGTCPTPGYEFNRRFLRDDGTVTLLPPEGSNLTPGGPVDTTMQWLAFESEDATPVGVVINYPCHNNCCSGVYHRDLGGRAGDALREALGGDFATPFLPAPCGDVVWRDFRQPYVSRGDELAREIGHSLGTGITASVRNAIWHSEVPLRIRSQVFDIPDRPLDESTFCHDNCRGDSENALAIARRRYDPEHTAVADRGPTVCPVEIQIISFGDGCAIATNPGELFVEFGPEIKRRSPFPVTLVSGLTNGYCGYVPTLRAFQHGGYETHRTVYTSRLATDAGNQIVRKSLKLLKLTASQDRDQTCLE